MRNQDIDSLSADGAQEPLEQRTAPRTAAGRALLKELSDTQDLDSFVLGSESFAPAILAIETEAAEQSGPLDVEALAAAISPHVRSYNPWPSARTELRGDYELVHARQIAAEYARLIPQPAQPAKPVCEHTSIGKRTINGPDGRMAGVESFCVACGKVNPLAQPAQPADTALLDAIQQIHAEAYVQVDGVGYFDINKTSAVIHRLASQPSSSEPDHG